MPSSNNSTLALAGILRSLDDESLTSLLRARIVREAGIGDFFDLADRLLENTSVQSALSALDRPTLTVVAALDTPAGLDELVAHLGTLGLRTPPAEVTARLDAARSLALVGFVDGRFVAWDAVTAQLAEWPSLGLPGLAELASPWRSALHPAAAADRKRVDALAAEHAFATTMAVVELIAEHQHEPSRELAKGGLSLPEAKRLALAANVDVSEVAALQSLAASAGLVSLEAGQWVASADASEWMLQSTPEIWSRLATAWLADLPRDIRQLLAGHTHDAWDESLQKLAAWLYPAGGAPLHDRVAARVRAAELLGIIADSTPSTAGAALVERGADAAAQAMAKLLPREVEQVYLQHDLSIVSPGPLAPRLDARLRTMAAVESHALASSYRVSLASVTRAFALGETAASITEFLLSLSLTGIPQPLAYLIAEAAARYGLVRVGATATGGSYVRSTDPNLLGTVLVDQSLSALGLARVADDRLGSRYDETTVFWLLSEARYPVAAETAEGDIVLLARPRSAPPVAVQAPDPAVSIVARLRAIAADAPQDNDRAWLERQLEAAVKARLTITVTVTVQDGSSVEYTLEPTGIGGGRLRARDRKADIERTLPLARITAVSSAV